MSNSGVAPVDLGSDVGKVRVLLGDTDPVNVVNNVGDNSPQLAAARCLETIAGSQALLLKSWSTDDLTVNGDRIAKELRETAKQLRAEALASESSEAFEIVAFGCHHHAAEYAEHTWWN